MLTVVVSSHSMNMSNFEKCTQREQMFVTAMIECRGKNRAAAYASLGCKTDTAADQAAHRMLRKQHVRDAIAEFTGQAMQAAVVDAQWLLNDLTEVAEMDLTSIMDDNGHYKPVQQWDEVIRRNIKKIKMGQVKITDDDGNVSLQVRPVEVTFVDTLKARDMIGKHVQVAAWKENIGLEGTMGTYTVPPEAVAEIHKKMMEQDDC